MAKPGRPGHGLDDYLYWQERLANLEASGLSIDEFCADEDARKWILKANKSDETWAKAEAKYALLLNNLALSGD